ncbi:hypothetical protein [Bacillus safensis]
MLELKTVLKVEDLFKEFVISAIDKRVIKVLINNKKFSDKIKKNHKNRRI